MTKIDCALFKIYGLETNASENSSVNEKLELKPFDGNIFNW